ncbi:hypothetical protein Dimus_038775 [Dionaea muscipula]
MGVFRVNHLIHVPLNCSSYDQRVLTHTFMGAGISIPPQVINSCPKTDLHHSPLSTFTKILNIENFCNIMKFLRHRNPEPSAKHPPNLSMSNTSKENVINIRKCDQYFQGNFYR